MDIKQIGFVSFFRWEGQSRHSWSRQSLYLEQKREMSVQEGKAINQNRLVNSYAYSSNGIGPPLIFYWELSKDTGMRWRAPKQDGFVPNLVGYWYELNKVIIFNSNSFKLVYNITSVYQ